MPERRAPLPALHSRKRVNVIVLALLALLSTGVVAARSTPLDPAQSCCDMLFYRSMAFNLVRVTRPEMNTPPPGISLQGVYDDPYFGKYYEPENMLNRQPPYVYRPAAPLLARTLARLPYMDINRAFHTLAVLSLWTAAFLSGLTVLGISGNLITSAAATVTVAALYRITAYHLWNYTMADPLAIALLALAVWLMFTRRDRWFLAVALLGLFAKETVALVLVAYVLLLAVKRRLTRRILLALGCIVGVYLAYRLTIPIPNNALSISSAYLGPPGPVEVISVAFVVFGPLSLFAATRIWFGPHGLLLSPLILGLFPLAMLTPDHERLYIYAFPVLVVATFGHQVRGRLALAALLAPAFLTFAYTQRAAMLPGLTTNHWRILSVVAVLLIEPAFLYYTGISRRSPLFRPLHHPAFARIRPHRT